MIVSDRLARRFWPGEDAIGKRIRIARPGTSWLTVVGVAGDVSDSHDAGVPLETWYVPFAQHAETSAAEHVYVMARAAGGDALALVPAVQRAIVGVDKTLAPYAPAAMDSYYAESLSRERIGAVFMLGFGVFGLALAALGVYGVMAFSVAQRTMEVGIRMALGAQVADILPLMLRRAVALVLAGIAAGAIGAIVVNRVLASLLTEVGGLDAAVLDGRCRLDRRGGRERMPVAGARRREVESGEGAEGGLARAASELTHVHTARPSTGSGQLWTFRVVCVDSEPR